nr:hypothetical protein [Tanacetum cinerariifolium]
MALPTRVQRHRYLRFEGLGYTNANITDFEERLDPRQGDLSAYWVGISSAGDFLSTSPSYNLIRDSMLRLCHRLITCSIAGRSQAPKKERLQGLTVIVRVLPMIDMAELVKLQICEELDNTWAWVASRPERW